MSKTLISVLVGVLVIGGGYLIYQNKNANPEGMKNPALEEGGTSAPLETLNPNGDKPTSGKKMAFSEFLKTGGSYKCEVNQYVNNIESKGTTYINDGMVRGEFNTRVNGMNMDSTLIVRDGYTYSWTSMMPSAGFKAKVVAQKGDTNTGTSGTYSFNSEQIGDYNCEAWSLDASKFTIPTDITFTDVSAK